MTRFALLLAFAWAGCSGADVSLGDGHHSKKDGSTDSTTESGAVDAATDAPSYDPCHGVVCGAACHPCDPHDTSCVPPPGTFVCDPHGNCTAQQPICP